MKINRIYHDVECSTYEVNHPEIYISEQASWKKILTEHICLKQDCSKNGKIVLDIGTGTGFVIDCLGGMLNSSDKVIFSDISEKMLDVSREKFKTFNFKKEFLLTDSTSFDLQDAQVDLITINSVLHHIPDVGQLFLEIDRILKPGGSLIIKHEPNKLFGKTFILRSVYLTLLYLRGFVPKLKSSLLGNKLSKNNVFLNTVLEKMRIEEGVVLDSFTQRQLSSIVDIHSPTASGHMDRERGFNPNQICLNSFPEYEVVNLSTYGYFGKINDKGSVMRKFISKILEIFFPGKGYFFDLVIKKNEKKS